MPIYRDGKRVLTPITEEELISESLFKGDPPKDFIAFAKDFAKKLGKKVTVKPMGLDRVEPNEFIKENPRWKYQFNIDNEMYNPTAGYATAGAKGAAGGIANMIVPGVGVAITAANATNNERAAVAYRDTLRNTIKSATGLKLHPATQMLYRVAPGKKYIYMAWPAVSMEGEYFTVYAVMLECVEYKKWAKRLGLRESAATVEIPGYDEAALKEDGSLDLSSIFAGFEEDTDNKMDKIIGDDMIELRRYQPYPELKKALNEHFDVFDKTTRNQLRAMNEAQHNTALTALTSKLYDQIVSKAHNIDFGEIPATKGDITKLSNFETMKETIGIIKGIVTEYKQDTKPVDEISVAIGNIQGRKDMFERAFRANCEMPMLMYNNMVMAVVVGTSHMITACIEFIKSPKGESFAIQLDKIAYIKSKDNLIYESISKFNRICENGDFDQAMNMIIDKRIRKFTGISIGAGIVVGVIILTNIIPLLRELVYLFYHTRVSLSDYCNVQADLLTMNAYNLANNDINTDANEKSDIVEKQNKIAEKFRKIANFFAIKDKKAEVEATKDIENSAKKYKLDMNSDIVSEEPDEEDSGSALF